MASLKDLLAPTEPTPETAPKKPTPAPSLKEKLGEQTPQTAPEYNPELENELNRVLGAPAPPGGLETDPELERVLNEKFGPDQNLFGADYQGPLEDVSNLPPADRFIAATLGQKDLGPAGYPDFGKRADLGLTDDPVQKALKFKSWHPDGEVRLVEVPPELRSSDAGQKVLVYRTNPNQPWARFDEPGVTYGDIADLSGAVPEAVGATAGALATGGAGLVGRAIAAGVGGVVGEGIKQLTEYARGYSDPNIGQDLAAALVFNAIGSAAGDLLFGGFKLLTAQGFPGFRRAIPEAIDTERAAKALGLPPMLVFQVSESPLMQFLGSQAAAKGARVGNATKKIMQATKDFMEGRINRAAVDNANFEMAKLEKETLTEVTKLIKPYGISDEQYAEIFKQAWLDWRKVSQTRVSALYEQAKKYGDPVFDMSELRELAQAHLQKQELGAVTLSPDIDQLVRRLRDLPDALMTVVEPNKINPAENVVTEAAEVLGRLRSELYEVIHPTAATQLRTPYDRAVAKDLYTKVVATFENPINLGQLKPGFAEAWKKASAAAKSRFETIEAFDAVMPAMTREFKPQLAVEKLWNAKNNDTIKVVRDMLIKDGLGDRWDTLATGLRNKLFASLLTKDEGPQAVLKQLSEWGPQTLQWFMSKQEVAGLRDALEGAVLIQQLDLPAIRSSIRESAEAVLTMIRNGNEGGAKHLLNSLPETHPLRQSIRAGLLDHLGNMQVVVNTKGPLKGFKVFDVKAIEKEIEAFRKTGIVGFLKQEDLDALHVLTQYLRFTTPGSDTGTGMAAAQQAGHFFEIGSKASSLQTIIENAVQSSSIGAVLASQWGRKLIMGLRPTTTYSRHTMARLVGLTVTDVAKQLQQEQKSGLRGTRDQLPYFGEAR